MVYSTKRKKLKILINIGLQAKCSPVIFLTQYMHFLEIKYLPDTLLTVYLLLTPEVYYRYFLTACSFVFTVVIIRKILYNNNYEYIKKIANLCSNVTLLF